MKLPTFVLTLCGLAAFAGCAKDEAVRDAESAQRARLEIAPEAATAIAEEAYIYAFPMMENYRTMYVQAVDRTAPGYKNPFNELGHMTELLGPEFDDIVRPNNDTMYSFAWLDLRAQPVVISVPEIGDRYYSIQLIDMFTHNFAYIGTRTTGTEAGSYVVAGPEWKGPPPDSIRGVFQSETNFAYCIIRTEVRGPNDVAAVLALQKRYFLSPMNVFLGHSTAPMAAGITFPSYAPERARSAGFIDLFNFLLKQVEVVPDEQALMERFAQIGIEPGALSASRRLSPEIEQAVDAGVGAAIVAISEGAREPSALDGVTARVSGGWSGIRGLFGDGPSMRGKYLARAVAAMVGLYGNDFEEAYYPMADEDASGNALDGSKHRYVIRFGREEMPPVDAFWSITMYSLPDQLMVANSIHRYSIGDRSALQHGPDGSVTIYVQRDSPGPMHENNWLPAPDGPFSLQFRMYLPKPEAMDPLYLPPPVRPID